MNLESHSPIIVIGMHRSGTSLVAKVLSELGIHIGTRLDNHNESECFKNINQQLLQDQGANWAKPDPFISQLGDDGFIKEQAAKTLHLWKERQDIYGVVRDDQLWGWKDPRNTITLLIWLKIFPEAKVIHVVRHGIDVALSLYRRERRNLILRYGLARKPRYELMFPPTITKSYKLWVKYVQFGMRFETNCAHRLFLRYEDLVSRPQLHLTTLIQFVDINYIRSHIDHLSKYVIRRPTQRSAFETVQVRLLLRMGLIDPQPLLDLGYEEIG